MWGSAFAGKLREGPRAIGDAVTILGAAESRWQKGASTSRINEIQNTATPRNRLLKINLHNKRQARFPSWCGKLATLSADCVNMTKMSGFFAGFVLNAP
ncbi:hypothetical protein [Tardiphaga sp.]|uniref:hypothetical protein n=1 Tax=Tardiphaga sp. TaxID=1926292 RepID=UPI00260B95E6|nr:hypothetical protein [Tardiphaga sp.]MDB5619219.1 hypothetical protein [Tardiphaga sp.]